MKRPNIILVLSDQLRADALGCYGNPFIMTPNMDFLASRGTRFSHAYTACPSCVPARSSLWSGQNQWHTGVLGMGWGQGPIPRDFRHTLAGDLTAAGYRTHMVGKSHFHMHPDREHMGFESMEMEEASRPIVYGIQDEYLEWFNKHAPPGVSPHDHGVDGNSWMARPWHLDEHLHPTWWAAWRAMEFVRSADPGRPFFLNIAFNRPHSPYTPPAFLFDWYLSRDIPMPVVGEWASMHDKPMDAVDPDAWHGKLAPELVRRARAGYSGEISFIDLQLGCLATWMARVRPDLAGNTWFLLISDHGDMQGDHNLWRKTYAYEGSARIPLLIVPPAGMRPRRGEADEVVELRDVMPTVLGIAGLPVPREVDGKSLLPLMRRPATRWRGYIHGEHSLCYSPEQEMQYVTDGRRKFVWLPRIGREQFFDLEKDPRELDDLAGDPARRGEVRQWRGHLIRELQGRRCGWVRGGKLYCPPGKPLVSPFRDRRWTGRDPA